MADSTTPPAFDLNKGIYFPQLTEEFKISRNAAYDYYSTNSGMYPKNPGSGGGGGGGGDLDGRVARLEQDIDIVKQNISAVNNEQAIQNNAISLNNTSINTVSSDVSNIRSNVSAMQEKQDDLSTAAQESINSLSAIKTGDDLIEIDDIVNNQLILSAAQTNLYRSF